MEKINHHKTKKAGKRLIAGLLFLCLILGLPCISGMAQAVDALSDNNEKEVGEAVSDNGTDETVSENRESLSAISQEQSASVWAYVYFGSYPQNEVTDEETKSAVDSAIGRGEGKPAGTEENSEGIDVWVNGVKYRRISKEDCDAPGYFDNVENNGYRYFQWKRIRWRVLESDETTIFAMADMAMDGKAYDNMRRGIWETCTLRGWLNNGFYKTAFNSAEQAAVIEWNVENSDNPYYSTEGGNDTKDKVYLLSVKEAGKKTYGFESSTYYSESRRLKTSDYANARGVCRWTFSENSEEYDYRNNCDWWLRSPGEYSYAAAKTDYHGWIGQGRGTNVKDVYGVVPVVHIERSSTLWSWTDDGTSGFGGEDNGEDGDDENRDDGTPSGPVHHHTGENDGTDTTTWSHVYFGSYPQDEVIDEALKSAIDSAINQGKGKFAGTPESSEGIDVWIDGTKYRRIGKADCNDVGEFDSVENNGYRYFKWERIKWRVLQNNGRTLFVAADMAMDCKNYNDARTEVTWETCTMRKWLGGSFYQNAFDSVEQAAIAEQELENGNNPDTYIEGGNNTTDKIYLLSIREVNEAYGFCSDLKVYSDSRRLKTSDYANARGAERSKLAPKGNCNWWLRTPGSSRMNAMVVGDYGVVDYWSGFSVDRGNYGCVPVLHINLSSDRWSMTDDGTSGSGGEDRGDDRDHTVSGNNGGTGNNDSDGGNTAFGNHMVCKITVSGISKKIAAGKKIKLSAEIFPTNAGNKALIWKSSNPKYAVVDADGVVRTKKAGAKKTVTITALAKDGSGVRAEYKIKIMKHAVKKVKIKTSSKSVKAGKTLKLKAAVTTTGKNANKKLKWTSSNDSYATVSSKGVVKAAKAGKGKTVTITAAATDGSGKKAKVKIKIK